MISLLSAHIRSQVPTLSSFILFIFLLTAGHGAFACSSTSGPSYSHSCTSDYFTSISASGGTSSSISYSGSSCSGTYFNYYATQGITATLGTTISMPIGRSTGYAADLSVWVDWNNNGTYEAGELCGSTYSFSSGASSTTYTFTVPSTGVTTGVNLHMRVFLSESGYSAPCSGSWGETCDYFFNANCAVTTPVSVSPASASICTGGTGTSLTASGMDVGGSYSWSPSTGLSATTGATVTANPPATTVYTVTGTTSAGCSDTQAVTITVTPSSLAGSLHTISSVCALSSITLTDGTPGGTWTGGTTHASVSSIGVVAGLTAGLDTAVYIVSSGACSIVRDTFPIIVNPLAYPAPISGPLSICVGSTITYTDDTLGGTWSINNSSATITSSGAVTGLSQGANNITYTYTNICNTAAIVLNITVDSLPVAVITPGSAITFCNGDNVILNGTSGTGYTYEWYNTGALISAATNANYSATTSGTYVVVITGAGNCKDTSASTSVTVNLLPVASITAGSSLSFCAGDSVVLSASTGTGYVYQWYNTTAIPGATNATYTATTSGNYTILITNGFGCNLMSAATAVVENPIPVATISYSGPTTFCSNDSLLLTAALGSGYSYRWYRTGTLISGVASSSYYVHTSGSYQATVIGAGGCADTSTGLAITVNIVPGAIATPTGDTNLCPGDFVTLTANTGMGLTYQWYTGATALSGYTNAYYFATGTGVYHVKVTDVLGCNSTSTGVNVTVNPATATAIAAGPTTFCDNSNVLLSANTGVGLTYQWTLDGAGIPGATGSAYTATAAGNYAVVVSNTAGCSATSAPAIATTLLPSPSGTLILSGSSIICGTDSTIIFADNTPGLVYQWYNSAGVITGATGNAYTAYTTDNYSVQITNSQPCTSIPSVAITQIPLPDASAMATGGTVFCVGGGVTLTVPTGNTYQWYNGVMPVAGATDAAYTAIAPGDYTVFVTGPGGCTNTSTPAITVTELTSLSIVPLSDTTFCWGGSAPMGLDIPPIAGVGYQWQSGGVDIPGATNSVYNATATGDYSCVVFAPGCSVSALSISVREFPLPNPVITEEGIYLTTQSYFSSYQWYKDLAPIMGAISYSTIPTGAGNYEVRVTDTNGCQSVSTAYPFTHSTTEVANINQQDVTVYPNPSTGMVHILSAEPVNIVINNIEGRGVLQQSDSNTIDISSLPDGTYLLQLYSDNGKLIKTVKLTKQ